MAASFIDLDGTVLRYHTSEFLPGVADRLTAYVAAGNQVYFISMRGPQDAGTEWSVEKTLAVLNTLPFPVVFISGVQSPRTVIDDTPPAAVHAITNDARSWDVR